MEGTMDSVGTETGITESTIKTTDQGAMASSTSNPKEPIVAMSNHFATGGSILIHPGLSKPYPAPIALTPPGEVKSMIATTVSTPSPRHTTGVITFESTSSQIVQLNQPVMYGFNIQQYGLSMDGNEPIVNLALQDYKTGDYIAAKDRCMQLLRQQPRNSRLLLLLSAIYYKTGQLDKSEHFSKLAIHSKPGMAEGYSNIANCLRSKGMIQQALANYRHALELKPTFIDGYLNLAYCLEEAGELSQAVDAYSMAIQYDPGLYDVRNDLGNVLRSMGRLEEARKCYMRSIETKSDFAIAWGNLGCVYSDMGELWLAIHHLEQATSLQPNLINAHVNFGNVYKGGKIFANARTCYQRALELNPLMTNIRDSMKEIEVLTRDQDSQKQQRSIGIGVPVEQDSPEVGLAQRECEVEKEVLDTVQKHAEEAAKVDSSNRRPEEGLEGVADAEKPKPEPMVTSEQGCCESLCYCLLCVFCIC